MEILEPEPEPAEPVPTFCSEMKPEQPRHFTRSESAEPESDPETGDAQIFPFLVTFWDPLGK